jgi:hypothetical protein
MSSILRKNKAVVRLLLAVLIFSGVTMQAWASPDSRCVNCDGCNGGMCGFCIVVAVQTGCGSYGPGAYATCRDNVWTLYCQG